MQYKSKLFKNYFIKVENETVQQYKIKQLNTNFSFHILNTDVTHLQVDLN